MNSMQLQKQNRIAYFGIAPYSMAIAFADWLQHRDKQHYSNSRLFCVSKKSYTEKPFARVDAKLQNLAVHPDYQQFKRHVLNHVQDDVDDMVHHASYIISGANSQSLQHYHEKVAGRAVIFDVAKSTVSDNQGNPTFPYILNPDAGYICGWSQYEAIMQGNGFMIDVAHQNIDHAVQVARLLSGSHIIVTPSMYPLHGQIYGTLKNIFGLVTPLVQQHHQLLDGHFEHKMIETLERITGDMILRYQLSNPVITEPQGTNKAETASHFINHLKTYYRQMEDTFQKVYPSGAQYRYASGIKMVYDVTFTGNNCPDVDARKSCSGNPKTRNYKIGESIAALLGEQAAHRVTLEQSLKHFWQTHNITDGYIPEGIHALKTVPEILKRHGIRKEDSRLLILIYELLLGTDEKKQQAFDIFTTNRLAEFLRACAEP